MSALDPERTLGRRVSADFLPVSPHRYSRSARIGYRQGVARGGSRRRREFFLLLGGATGAMGRPRFAVAQAANKVWRVGYLSGRYGPSEMSRSFVRGLRELGYVEGQNLVVEYRFALGK